MESYETQLHLVRISYEYNVGRSEIHFRRLLATGRTVPSTQYIIKHDDKTGTNVTENRVAKLARSVRYVVSG